MKIARPPTIAILLAATVLSDGAIWGPCINNTRPPFFRKSGRCCPCPEKECDDGDDDDHLLCGKLTKQVTRNPSPLNPNSKGSFLPPREYFNILNQHYPMEIF